MTTNTFKFKFFQAQALLLDLASPPSPINGRIMTFTLMEAYIIALPDPLLPDPAVLREVRESR